MVSKERTTRILMVVIGTVFSAFGFGPFIQFFNTHLSEKLVSKP